MDNQSKPDLTIAIVHVQELVGSRPHEVVAVIHDSGLDQVVAQTTINSFGYLAKEIEKDVSPELVNDVIIGAFDKDASPTHRLGIIDDGTTQGMILVPRPAADHICAAKNPTCGD